MIASPVDESLGRWAKLFADWLLVLRDKLRQFTWACRHFNEL